mmetsp:Transcript_23752/g.70235  ORF Transcript_23752/g.70235 Transcript_23752/m.70235 type:complete len:334 (-) Transcript_23752:224-1225(-)
MNLFLVIICYVYIATNELVLGKTLATNLRLRPHIPSDTSDDSIIQTDDKNNNITDIGPIVFLHGINGHASEFDDIINWMKDAFGEKGVPTVHSLGIREGLESLMTPLDQQRDEMVAYLEANAASLGIERGFNFVAHSQGALLARSVIQMLPKELHVRTYISMAGPQRGQWGDCGMSNSGIAPKIARKMARPVGWIAFYNAVAQKELSFANYWNDPGHTWLFERECNFLPAVNGYNGNITGQRTNFLRIGKAVFLGSPEDDCINPPLSSVFEFIGEDGSSTSSFEQSLEYTSDAFGLRTLQDEGRVVLKAYPWIDHMSWLKPSVFERFVLPELL